MATECTHVDQVRDVTPSADGCEECLKRGDTWVHRRLCLTCGHVGCCDDSKNRVPARSVGDCDEALPRDPAPDHPIVRAGRGLGLVLCRPTDA